MVMVAAGRSAVGRAPDGRADRAATWASGAAVAREQREDEHRDEDHFGDRDQHAAKCRPRRSSCRDAMRLRRSTSDDPPGGADRAERAVELPEAVFKTCLP
jgi:hypothetical protein